MALPASRRQDPKRGDVRRHGRDERGARLSTSLSIVVVTHDSREAIERTLFALSHELREQDELIVVDNASSDGTPDAVATLAPEARLVRSRANLGFTGGCNLGGTQASGDLLVLLNPDAAPAPGFREAIARPLRDGRGWSAWMGLVTTDGGRRVNTRGGVMHFTGIAWAGGAGEPLALAAVAEPATGAPSAEPANGAPSAEPANGAPAGEPLEPREVAFASGACLALPLEVWRQAGGFPAEYFLYHEDVDLSLRLRLAGGRIGIEPAARVDHDYEFEKGEHKWRFLERNRWAVIVRTYPPGLLALVFPALVATEVALVAVALTGGWGRQKALAWLDFAAALPRLLRERRRIQSQRRIGSRELAAWLSPDLGSPYLGRAGRSRLLRLALRAYWSAVVALLGERS